MELQNEELNRAEVIFSKTLMSSTSVQLWSMYLDYIRRRHNINTDATGSARLVVQEAFNLTLKQVGIDKDSGPIWQEYIQFVKSGPGVIGGTGWQDQQKVDAVRAAYRRALSIPTRQIHGFWLEYSNFEVTVSKQNVGESFGHPRYPKLTFSRVANSCRRRCQHI
jgi:cleavage stimulation factor subunit 3